MMQLDPGAYLEICELKIKEAIILERSYISQANRGNHESASYIRQQAYRAFDEAIEMECAAKATE